MSLKPGDPVEVSDPGLAMLRRFAPAGVKPNHHGFVDYVMDDGLVMVKFPIGDDDMDEHSQVASYPAHMVHPRTISDAEI